MRDARSLLPLLTMAVLALAAPARAQNAPRIVPGEEYPLRDRATELRVEDADGAPVAGVPVRALYRPNSQTPHTAELGPTGADGTVSWTPDDAGVVLLAAGGPEAPIAQKRVSVRFGSFPPLGLLVMVVAALLLFGGAAMGFVWLMRSGTPLPSDEPPST